MVKYITDILMIPDFKPMGDPTQQFYVDQACQTCGPWPDMACAGHAHPSPTRAKTILIRHNMACDVVSFDTPDVDVKQEGKEYKVLYHLTSKGVVVCC